MTQDRPVPPQQPTPNPGVAPTANLPVYTQPGPVQPPQRQHEPYPQPPGSGGGYYGPPTAQPYGAPPPFYGATAVSTRRPVSTGLLVVAWIVAVLTLFYLLPWAIAVTRNRSNMGAIFVLNFLLGWSFIGWVVSLVMACGSEPQTNVVVVNNHPGYPGR